MGEFGVGSRFRLILPRTPGATVKSEPIALVLPGATPPKTASQAALPVGEDGATVTSTAEAATAPNSADGSDTYPAASEPGEASESTAAIADAAGIVWPSERQGRGPVAEEAPFNQNSVPEFDEEAQR